MRGILHATDILPLLLKDDWDDFDIRDCMRPAMVIPESKRLNVLLQEFRVNRNHMALVIDEYGHVSGAVTMAAGAPMVPLSAAPLTPSGLSGVGDSMW